MKIARNGSKMPVMVVCISHRVRLRRNKPHLLLNRKKQETCQV